MCATICSLALSLACSIKIFSFLSKCYKLAWAELSCLTACDLDFKFSFLLRRVLLARSLFPFVILSLNALFWLSFFPFFFWVIINLEQKSWILILPCCSFMSAIREDLLQVIAEKFLSHRHATNQSKRQLSASRAKLGSQSRHLMPMSPVWLRLNNQTFPPVAQSKNNISELHARISASFYN